MSESRLQTYIVPKMSGMSSMLKSARSVFLFAFTGNIIWISKNKKRLVPTLIGFTFALLSVFRLVWFQRPHLWEFSQQGWLVGHYLWILLIFRVTPMTVLHNFCNSKCFTRSKEKICCAVLINSCNEETVHKSASSGPRENRSAVHNVVFYK